MPAIPASTRSSITLRLLDHAEKHWPQLARLKVTCRASFAYITGALPGGEQIPLFRLRYGWVLSHPFGFAIYTAARERYEDALLLTGYPTGTPQEALDTACTVHLAGLGHEPDSEPSTNLRRHPLRPRGRSCWPRLAWWSQSWAVHSMTRRRPPIFRICLVPPIGSEPGKLGVTAVPPSLRARAQFGGPLDHQASAWVGCLPFGVARPPGTPRRASRPRGGTSPAHRPLAGPEARTRCAGMNASP